MPVPRNYFTFMKTFSLWKGYVLTAEPGSTDGLNRDQNNYVRNVHAQLRRNRKILSDLYGDGHHRIHRDALIAQGYNFTFFTHLVETREGLRWSYCFEFGFRESDEGYLELQKSSSYLDLVTEELDNQIT